MPLSPSGPCTCARGSLSQLLLLGWTSHCCGRQLAPCLPKDAEKELWHLQEHFHWHPIFCQGPCPAGCTLPGDEVDRASRPPLHRMCHLRHCSGTPAPGNCPHPSFGGITLPSTDIPAHGPDRDGSSWLGECLWPSPRTGFPGIPTKTTTFAQSGVRTGSRGCPACLKPA